MGEGSGYNASTGANVMDDGKKYGHLITCRPCIPPANPADLDADTLVFAPPTVSPPRNPSPQPTPVIDAKRQPHWRAPEEVTLAFLEAFQDQTSRAQLNILKT